MSKVASATLYPAPFWVTPDAQLKIAMGNIRLELQEELQRIKSAEKELEAYRLERKVTNDLSMMEETGYCHGIENYSGHLEFRKSGEAPFTLLDYYPKNFLTFVDESHMSVPQLRGMIAGDRARKQTLIEYGFRLPSAIDNRPLEYSEFLKKAGQIIFTSATPAPYEKTVSQNTVELLVRPTGLLEPAVEIRKADGQLQDALKEIKKRVEKKERVLVTTLTKRLAEDLSEFLAAEGIKAQYLHSEVKTLERPSILASLRKGEFDVVVGVNLLREGLDLPEVSLIIIFDADKEGFLRSETTFVQIMGRAARHENGNVIMYADTTTGSMERAIKEVNRRRSIQEQYNLAHGITPKAIVKEIRPWTFGKKTAEGKSYSSESQEFREIAKSMNVKDLKKEMQTAAKNLNFERAAELRDTIKKLSDAGPRSRVLD
jgi:excinuclease ABC subunit B